MYARVIRPGHDDPEATRGAVVAADVRDGAGRVVLRKGARLGAEHEPALSRLAGAAIPVVDLEQGELEQDEVARRIAAAVAGPGTRWEEPRTGQARVRAAVRGLLRVRREAVEAINRLWPLLLFTSLDAQAVRQGDEVAGAKAATLATPERTVEAAERAAAHVAPVLRVDPFAPRRAALLVTERLDRKARPQVSRALGRKLGWFGSSALNMVELPHDERAVREAIRAALDAGADLLLISGANALDPLDRVLVGVRSAGGEVSRTGVAGHPGSMMWVGEVAGVPALGVATCAGFGKNTIFDLVLARVLAGERPEDAASEIGYGGLLEGPAAEGRFPPYD